MAQTEAVEKEKGHELFGLSYCPYGGLTLSRLNEEWSTGFLFGAEIDAGGAFVDIEYELHDILTEDRKETVPWDGTFRVVLGTYF
jgi:hypothetical protein